MPSRVESGYRYRAFSPSGAGRVIDQRWPQDMIFRQNGQNPDLTVIDRLGANDPKPANLSQTNGNFGWNVNINGRSAATIGATVVGAPNGGKWNFQSMVANPALLAGPGFTTAPSFPGVTSLGAYQWVCVASYVNPVAPLADTVDNGLELCCAGQIVLDDGNLCFSANPGLGFRVYDNQKVQMIMRAQANGVLFKQDITPVVYDCRDWNEYKLRIIGAYGQVNAVAKFYINEQLMFQKSWGAGNVMPQTNGNYAGFKTFLTTNGGSALGYSVASLDFHAAPDEANLD